MRRSLPGKHRGRRADALGGKQGWRFAVNFGKAPRREHSEESENFRPAKPAGVTTTGARCRGFGRSPLGLLRHAWSCSRSLALRGYARELRCHLSACTGAHDRASSNFRLERGALRPGSVVAQDSGRRLPFRDRRS